MLLHLSRNSPLEAHWMSCRTGFIEPRLRDKVCKNSLQVFCCRLQLYPLWDTIVYFLWYVNSKRYTVSSIRVRLILCSSDSSSGDSGEEDRRYKGRFIQPIFPSSRFLWHDVQVRNKFGHLTLSCWLVKRIRYCRLALFFLVFFLFVDGQVLLGCPLWCRFEFEDLSFLIYLTTLRAVGISLLLVIYPVLSYWDPFLIQSKKVSCFLIVDTFLFCFSFQVCNFFFHLSWFSLYDNRPLFRR